MTVWLCQCLCPGRHCILAASGEADSEAEAARTVRAPFRRQVVALLAAGTLNPWCALCDANRATWRYELRRTRFATMAEAEPALLEAEARNFAANLAFGDIHKTRRPN
jgi:hypothetical protein